MNGQEATLTSGMSTITPGAIEALRRALRGEVLLPGDTGYDTARHVWNAMIDRRPSVIARCRGVADVIEAVSFACDQDLPISIRAGGHNVAGHAVCDVGLMIDLSLMRSVRVDPNRRRAWVEGGATWRDVDQQTTASGLATPGGVVSATGVAGLTLSGGIGWLRASHGLSIDNLISLDVVLAGGRLVRASEAENPDLFWALRGGGGNFGVVTALEFQLHPIPTSVTLCAPFYGLDTAHEAIRAWRDFLADKNDQISSVAEFSTIPEAPDFPAEAHGKRGIMLAAVHAGGDESGERLMRPLRELRGKITDFSCQLPYAALQTMNDVWFPYGTQRCYWKSLYLAKIDEAAIARIVDKAGWPPSHRTLCSLWNLGGAVARVAEGATAFGDRSMPYMLSIDSIWDDPEGDAVNIRWTRNFWETMQPYSQKGRIYLNFAGHG
jgi:FAD/FMN-containing dehydrogenase